MALSWIISNGLLHRMKKCVITSYAIWLSNFCSFKPQPVLK